MRFYGTVKSERASKGQGGEWLKIDIVNERKELMMQLSVKDEKVISFFAPEHMKILAFCDPKIVLFNDDKGE